MRQRATIAGEMMSDDLHLARLLEKLRASDRNDRWSAVQDLRALGDTRAVQPLLELTLTDPDEDVPREAAWGVGEFIRAEKIGVMEATRRLMNAMNDIEPTTRGNVVLALSRMPFDENTLDSVI